MYMKAFSFICKIGKPSKRARMRGRFKAEWFAAGCDLIKRQVAKVQSISVHADHGVRLEKEDVAAKPNCKMTLLASLAQTIAHLKPKEFLAFEKFLDVVDYVY